MYFFQGLYIIFILWDYSLENFVIHLKKKIFFTNIILWKSPSKFSKNEPVCMCKEGWCVQLWQERGSLHQGTGIVWNTFKVGGIEKRDSKQNFKKGEQAGLRVGCYKTGCWNPLTNYIIDLWSQAIEKTIKKVEKITKKEHKDVKELIRMQKWLRKEF